jgi:hypothetical protein
MIHTELYASADIYHIKASATSFTGSQVGFRAGLDVLANRKIGNIPGNQSRSSCPWLFTARICSSALQGNSRNATSLTVSLMVDPVSSLGPAGKSVCQF